MKNLSYNIQQTLLKKGATHVVISANKNTTDQIIFSNNRINITKSWNANNVDIFIAIKNRIATTSIKEFTKSEIDSTLNKLIKTAKISAPNKDFIDIAHGPFKYKKIKDSYDKRILKINNGNIAEKVIDKAMETGSTKTAGLLESSESKIFLLSSAGVEAEDSSTHIHLSIRAFASKNASGHTTSSSRILEHFNYVNAAQEAGQIATLAKNPKPGIPGRYDIIFKPLAFASLLSLIGEASSVFSVESGLSCLKNKINKNIASKEVTFFDNPTLPNGLGSIKFDAEGYPTQKTGLIEKGKFKTYLHNTSTAKRYKIKSTGNAGIIAPQPFNLILEKSDWKTEEMIKSVKKGLMITNIWYTRFKNYITGEFSTIPRDGIFLIKNGEIKHPITGIRISDSLLDVLKNIAAIGNNPTQITSWETSTPTTTPDVLVKNVNVTKPKE